LAHRTRLPAARDLGPVKTKHAVVLGAVVVFVSGCASGDQWDEWKRYSTHLASDVLLNYFTGRPNGAM